MTSDGFERPTLDEKHNVPSSLASTQPVDNVSEKNLLLKIDWHLLPVLAVL